MALSPIISNTPINTIQDVITVMRAIEAALPDEDGLKWFNHLYLKVTLAVLDAPDHVSWNNEAWLNRLDVEFAKLYFNAIVAYEANPNNSPRAWNVLFSARYKAHVMRLQFALAGMNAHINHDLCIALVNTGLAMGVPVQSGRPEHQDFETVNGLLAEVETQVKGDLENWAVATIDGAMGSLDDFAAMWSVGKARDTAWMNGEILWHLKDVALLKNGFLTNLDRLTALAGRALLIPV